MFNVACIYRIKSTRQTVPSHFLPTHDESEATSSVRVTDSIMSQSAGFLPSLRHLPLFTLYPHLGLLSEAVLINVYSIPVVPIKMSTIHPAQIINTAVPYFAHAHFLNKVCLNGSINQIKRK